MSSSSSSHPKNAGGAGAAVWPDTVVGADGAAITPTNDAIAALLAWWQSLPAPPDAAPVWDGRYVVELRPWLGWLFTVRFPDGDLEAGYYSLSGTELVRTYGFDITNTPLSATMFGQGSDVVIRAYRTCVESRRPLYSRNQFTQPGRSTVAYERLALPFANADGAIDRVLGAMYFLERPPNDWLDDTTRMVGIVDITL